MPHPGGICRAAPQPASFTQWKEPEVKDGKHGAAGTQALMSLWALLGFFNRETAGGNHCIDILISV